MCARPSTRYMPIIPTFGRWGGKSVGRARSGVHEDLVNIHLDYNSLKKRGHTVYLSYLIFIPFYFSEEC